MKLLLMLGLCFDDVYSLDSFDDLSQVLVKCLKRVKAHSNSCLIVSYVSWVKSLSLCGKTFIFVWQITFLDH